MGIDWQECGTFLKTTDRRPVGEKPTSIFCRCRWSFVCVRHGVSMIAASNFPIRRWRRRCLMVSSHRFVCSPPWEKVSCYITDAALGIHAPSVSINARHSTVVAHERAPLNTTRGHLVAMGSRYVGGCFVVVLLFCSCCRSSDAWGAGACGHRHACRFRLLPSTRRMLLSCACCGLHG